MAHLLLMALCAMTWQVQLSTNSFLRRVVYAVMKVLKMTCWMAEGLVEFLVQSSVWSSKRTLQQSTVVVAESTNEMHWKSGSPHFSKVW